MATTITETPVDIADALAALAMSQQRVEAVVWRLDDIWRLANENEHPRRRRSYEDVGQLYAFSSDVEGRATELAQRAREIRRFINNLMPE